MAKRVSKKEKLFNLELYVQILEERIQRLEEENSKHSTYISHNVTDIRNVEVAMDGLKLELGEQGGALALLRDNVQEHVINIDNLNTAVNGILTSAKDADVKNSIINYLISTDFKGSVRHKRLISRLKREVKEALKANSFEELKREILNGDRSLDDLIDYKHILMKHEDDQKVVDYCNKEEE